MELVFGPRGILQIDDARIIYRNFSGAPSKYNREGDRNFAVIIPNEEMADALVKEGWNVKIKPPREEGDDPFIFLPVKVKFNDRGPIVRLMSGRNKRILKEDTISILDNVDILKVDMDIRPYDWDVNGKSGRTAYLQSICVTQEVDRFADRFDDDIEED